MSDIDESLFNKQALERRANDLLEQCREYESSTPGFNTESVLNYMKDHGGNDPWEAYQALQTASTPAHEEREPITKHNLISKIKEALPDHEKIERQNNYEKGIPLKEQLAKVIRVTERNSDPNRLLDESLKRGL